MFPKKQSTILNATYSNVLVCHKSGLGCPGPGGALHPSMAPKDSVAVH